MAQSEFPEINLSNYTVDENVLQLVPPLLAEKYKIMPLFKIGNTLTVAMADPKNVVAIDALRSSVESDISIVKASPKDIEGVIADYYGISGIVESVVKEYSATVQKTAPKQSVDDQSPIVKLVNVLISQAVSQKASDIHIEPQDKELRIRLRIDGILHEEVKMPIFMLSPIVSRIKVLAGMDIAESRVP